jgi:hypothetical protein
VKAKLVGLRPRLVDLWPRVWPGALFAALVLTVYANPLWIPGASGPRTFVGRDILPYNMPLEKVVHDAWSRGRLPVWWDTVSGGRPLMPNPNAGVFYPLRPALSRFSFPVAMRIFPVFHWIVGGLGVLLLVRGIGGSRGAAWIGAVSFAFSGVIVSEVYYTNFQPGASLLPWTLWALVRPAKTAASRILEIALVYGALLLAGDAFSLTLSLLAALLWLVLETPPGERGRTAAALGIGLLAAFLLASPQVVATALLAPETRRIIGGIPLGEATDFSTPLWRLLELFVPYPFGESWSSDLARDWGTFVARRFFLTFFVGPIALAGLLRGKRNPPRGWRFVRVLLAVTIVFAVAGRFLPDAWDTLPSPVPLRYPEKFMVGATLALAISAAIAVDRLRQFRTGGRGFLIGAGALAVLAGVAGLSAPAAGRVIVSAVRGAPELGPVAARDLPAALAVAGLLWAATAIAAELASGREGPLLGIALLLLTLVPIAANRAIAQTAPDSEVYPPTRFAREIAKRDADGTFRALDETIYHPPSPLLEDSHFADPSGVELSRQSWFYFTPTLWNRGTVLNADLDAGDLSRIDSLRRVAAFAAGQRDSAAFFSGLSLRFGLRFKDQEPLAGFRPFGGDAFRRWDENPSALPDLRLVTKWREATGPVDALRTLPGLAAGEVVVETGRRQAGTARPGKLQVRERSPERLVLETESPDAAWLFVLRGDWSYRSVAVDGRAVDTVPAQLAFTAVPVPAGSHRVEWREEAPGLEVSRLCALAGGLFLLVLVFLRRRTTA